MNGIPKQAQTVLFVGGSVVAVWFVVTRVIGGDIANAAGAVADAAGDAANAVNPVNNDNIFSRAANAVTQAITGESGTSLGSTIFDLFNPEPEVATDTPENNLNGNVRRDPNVFLLDPFGDSVSDQLRAAGLLN